MSYIHFYYLILFFELFAHVQWLKLMPRKSGNHLLEHYQRKAEDDDEDEYVNKDGDKEQFLWMDDKFHQSTPRMQIYHISLEELLGPHSCDSSKQTMVLQSSNLGNTVGVPAHLDPLPSIYQMIIAFALFISESVSLDVCIVSAPWVIGIQKKSHFSSRARTCNGKLETFIVFSPDSSQYKLLVNFLSSLNNPRSFVNLSIFLRTILIFSRWEVSMLIEIFCNKFIAFIVCVTP
ncbi:hypothetical protein EGR_07658 [Echinococcus granulosus]|uniref:Uncharacterized protein n=1 Tax=Echinococcus granulosus TaxID=6210 RepID=W6U8F0_ECHGR|nr:hypothetical protein EGR_07658 [Echinococcus granulosus]EUB57493.1 hypothetical protein EGR_07658 [Echinococcus granulosus]